MRKLASFLVTAWLITACNNDAKVLADGSDTTAKKEQAEFADAKFAEQGKEALKKFESGDVDGWLSNFDENAVYSWSSGDSIAGKAAIATYWKERRNNVIDSIQFSNDIWLPIQVNEPQKGPDMPGVWLLGWYQVNVKYKSGKRLVFWVHEDLHYNEAGKIDRAIQYIDKAPINAAVSAK